MSRAPWAMAKPDRVPTNQAPRLWDTTVGWRFNNPRMDALYPIVSLGETAENVAEQMQITREDQDRYALESQRRAVEAINAGNFRDEIASVSVSGRKGAVSIVDTDEHPRYRKSDDGYELATSLENLASLAPAFRKGGTVTAGNSSGINDGAATLLLGSRERAEELGLKPMARWLGSAAAGVDPGVMGLGPVPATEKLLQRLGLTIDDIDLVELNEAFAAQVHPLHATSSVSIRGSRQRERRRHRAGPPDRLFRRAHTGDAAARDEAARSERQTPLLWPRDPVRGRRHGRIHRSRMDRRLKRTCNDP